MVFEAGDFFDFGFVSGIFTISYLFSYVKLNFI